MSDYLTEQEQVELLKSWIKQYSLVILAGVAMAVIAITGWRYYQQRQLSIQTHASSIYDEMLTMRAHNDPAGTFIQADKLFTHYPKTTYGYMAALMLARDAVVKKDYTLAQKHLNWALNHCHVASLCQIARIRLARVLIADQKPDDAVKLLQKINDKSFNGLTDEVKGDAYLAMNDRVKALHAYGQALNELPNAEVIRPLLQMKYDNLTTTAAS